MGKGGLHPYIAMSANRSLPISLHARGVELWGGNGRSRKLFDIQGNSSLKYSHTLELQWFVGIMAGRLCLYTPTQEKKPSQHSFEIED